MRQPYKLSPSEVEILRRGSEDPNIITDYWFRPAGASEGWKFDQNFDPEGAWQKIVHHAAQCDIIVIGGFATGKTSGIAMSASTWGMTLPWFKFLNVAETAFQAKQMYDYILTAASGTPFEKLIWEKPRRPYHKITLRFRIEEVTFESTFEFMSVDDDATGILSWEGDWINIEEAGLLDNLEEIVTAVGSRLRGSVRGRSRLGRLSMISNSWDNDYLWYYFDQAEVEPDEHLSLVVATRHNGNVSPEQLQRMLKRIPEDEREKYLEGTRPEGRGNYFPKRSVYICESKLLSEFIQAHTIAGTPGYSLTTVYGAGTLHFTTPPLSSEKGTHIVIGDPGTGGAPARNAPAIMVWGIPHEFPAARAYLAALWWGNGNGAITPFVDKLLEFRNIYKPVVTGVDSTGTQKNMAEMINLQYLNLNTSNAHDAGVTAGVTGLDFSGTKKNGYLVVGRMFVENNLLTWPRFLIGLRSQLTNYDPERDKKIAQDLVATLCMSAFVLRVLFNVDLYNKPTEEDPAVVGEAPKRFGEGRRERRSGRTNR